MLQKVIPYALSLIAASCISCATAGVKADVAASANNNPAVVKKSTSMSADELCANLKDLKRRPLKETGLTGDPIYDALLEKWNDVIPCLIEKIADTAEMDDPSPHPAHPEKCAVGDTAFFVLFDITGREFKPEDIFPASYLKRWKNEGIYIYYDYAQEPANRTKLQQYWQDWAKDHRRDTGTR